MMNSIRTFALALTLSIAAPSVAQMPAASKLTGPALYELRTYYVNPGKLETLQTRFKDHAVKLQIKYGMTPVAYWVKQDGGADGSSILIYILAYPSRAAREASWTAFRADPEWQAAATASELNGKLLAKVESTYMTMTDWSPKPKAADGTVLK